MVRWGKDGDQGGGMLANVERGPIKVKAKGNMNDLVFKHTWGQANMKRTHQHDRCLTITRALGAGLREQRNQHLAWLK